MRRGSVICALFATLDYCAMLSCETGRFSFRGPLSRCPGFRSREASGTEAAEAKINSNNILPATTDIHQVEGSSTQQVNLPV